jgi:hypothetical protein
MQVLIQLEKRLVVKEGKTTDIENKQTGFWVKIDGDTIHSFEISLYSVQCLNKRNVT